MGNEYFLIVVKFQRETINLIQRELLVFCQLDELLLPHGIIRLLKENRLKDLFGRLGSYCLEDILSSFEESLFRMFWILQKMYCRELLTCIFNLLLSPL